MSGPFVHLALNHIPIVGVIFAAALLAVAWTRRSLELTRVSLAALVVLALVAVAVYLSGEAAEEAIEGLAGVSEARIEPHEEAALFGLIGIEALGAAALAGLWMLRRPGAAARPWAGGVLVLAVIVSGILAWTAHRGGQIRHPELRGDALPAAEEAER